MHNQCLIRKGVWDFTLTVEPNSQVEAKYLEFQLLNPPPGGGNFLEGSDSLTPTAFMKNPSAYHMEI